jgi:hypothetical protein
MINGTTAQTAFAEASAVKGHKGESEKLHKDDR